MDIDRRIAPRHLACFPAHITRPDGTARSVLISDLSIHGALLFTRSKPEVGEAVQLSLYITPDTDSPRPAVGHVVRVERRSRDVSDVWPYSVAVEFDEPLTRFEAEVKALADQQAKLGVTARRTGPPSSR